MLCLLVISHLHWGGEFFITFTTFECTVQLQLRFDSTVICQPMHSFPVSVQLSNLRGFGITLVTFVSKSLMHNLFVKGQILWAFGNEFARFTIIPHPFMFYFYVVFQVVISFGFELTKGAREV